MRGHADLTIGLAGNDILVNIGSKAMNTAKQENKKMEGEEK
jgi:hypothetical protein